MAASAGLDMLSNLSFPETFEWRGSPASGVRYPVIAIALYLATIFGLQRLMRDRPPLRLSAPALLHNAFLCALSAAMCGGTLWELAGIYMRDGGDGGVVGVFCDRGGQAMKGRLGIWMYVFYLSKFYELLDTVLMVLKKRRLNFLHVYHHCIVIPLFYVYMTTGMVSQWILVVANSTVHVLMYYYYAMSTAGRTVWWKKYITQAQIVQFIIDLTATWPYPFLYHSAKGCSGSMRGWLFGQAVGLSFFKLFRDFYVRSYNAGKTGGTAKKTHVADDDAPKKAD